MVDINLIPAALRKKGSGSRDSVAINIAPEILVGVSSILILLMIVAHLFLGYIWWKAAGRLSNYKSNWQDVLPDKDQMESMNKESANLKKKIKTISEMTMQKTVLWAPKFNIISDDIPKGLWIRRMTLDKTGLMIEGSVVSKNADEINNVGLFLSSLKQNSDFIKDFSSLEVNSIQRGKSNAVDVTDFTVMAKLK